jgi:flagellar hook assembly protein FlgD
VGWRNKRFASGRTPGTTNHLDPHASHGYYRAVTGDLGMRASEWRGGGATTAPSDPPAITSLAAAGPTSAAGVVGLSTDAGATFHPNADGLADELLVRHTVTRATYLDVTVTNAQTGATVRNFTVWSESGAGTSRWDGRADGGAFVRDGIYSLTYVPRDRAGQTGSPAATEATVLRSVAVPVPSPAALFARDGDNLARTSTVKVNVNQQARVGWTIRDAAGNVVRTVRAPAETATGVLSFAWDGRTDGGAFVPDGTYRSVVTAETAFGSYGHERPVYVGAFRLTPSVSNPARGTSVKFVVLSTEGLAARPKLRITQPGLAPYWVTMNHVSGRKYQVTVTLRSGGTAGTMGLLVRGTDSNGKVQETSYSQSIR